eukprot:3777306-Rhodomonas_salina.1
MQEHDTTTKKGNDGGNGKCGTVCRESLSFCVWFRTVELSAWSVLFTDGVVMERYEEGKEEIMQRAKGWE